MKRLIEPEEIAKRVKEIGDRINSDYRGQRPILVGVLKGAFMFLSDLLKEIDIPVEIDFLSIHSYNGTESSGVVRITQDLSLNIEGRDVILVEDIVDSGRTLDYIIKNLKTRQPKSIAVCTLLKKKTKRFKRVSIKYVGFEIPDRFVVGYGLDYNNQYRNLNFIGVLNDQ